jgi:endonuclease YncB( thermonuclease family)
MHTAPTGLYLRRNKPSGAKPLALILILAVAVSLHAVRGISVRPASDVAAAPRRTIVGRAWVIDGDTIDVARVRIRLVGIDAPESDQTCGDADGRRWFCGHAATHALIGHLVKQTLHCADHGLDRYRRTLAVCTLPDGADVNAWLVQQGWALTYHSSLYRTQEAEARVAKRAYGWAASYRPGNGGIATGTERAYAANNPCRRAISQ